MTIVYTNLNSGTHKPSDYLCPPCWRTTGRDPRFWKDTVLAGNSVICSCCKTVVQGPR